MSEVKWIRGMVYTELQNGELVTVEGVLIKTSQGFVTHTNEKGMFECPICKDEHNYALCAYKHGFQMWVDSKRLDLEGKANEWEIVLAVGPEASSCELIMLPKVGGPACIMPQVVDCNTLQPIPNAQVKLDSQSWQQTDASGNGRCLCAQAGGQHTLKARADGYVPYPKSQLVVLQLGVTLTPANYSLAVICLTPSK